MKRCILAFPILALLCGLAAACGSDVDVQNSSGSGGTGGSKTTTATTGTVTCAGSAPLCAAGCGSDWFPEEAACVQGTWVCPPGTVNPEDCPPGTCWGPPFSCEVCGPSGWECVVDPPCVGGCNGTVCLECPSEPGPVFVGDFCICECNANGETICAVAQGCCTQDMDCGDEQFVPCVNHVCKQPVPGKCWSDAECAPGTVCVGASVCPCLYKCEVPDEPGDCLPTP